MRVGLCFVGAPWPRVWVPGGRQEPAVGSGCGLTHCVCDPAQKAKNVGAVERLTDTSKYTGSHKERFDETGKGKGKSGRENIVDNSGYVSAYKNAGTYDAKVKK